MSDLKAHISVVLDEDDIRYVCESEMLAYWRDVAVRAIDRGFPEVALWIEVALQAIAEATPEPEGYDQWRLPT